MTSRNTDLRAHSGVAWRAGAGGNYGVAKLQTFYLSTRYIEDGRASLSTNQIRVQLPNQAFSSVCASDTNGMI
jgi:hypothetical protein